MSHFKLREEKDCLNCGTTVEVTYCSACGQENREPRISFFKLITHFVSDIVHFDGKFFASLKILFLKPGLLPKEFIEGKRVRYVDPIRMYIFTSAIFFFIFFLIINVEKSINWGDDKILTKLERDSTVNVLIKKLAKRKVFQQDSINIKKQIQLLQDTTRAITLGNVLDLNSDFTFINISNKNYTSKKQYDSIQNALPSMQKDGWVTKKFMYKEIELNNKFRKDRRNASTNFSNIFFHQLPFLLFVSLPIFALILKLMYVRRKKYFFVDHSIFSIYYYIFSFIIFLIVILLSQLKDAFSLSFIKYVELIFILYWIIYLHKSLKRFYEQGRSKTLLKLFFICTLGLVSIMFLFIVFFFFSIFQFK